LSFYIYNEDASYQGLNVFKELSFDPKFLIICEFRKAQKYYRLLMAPFSKLNGWDSSSLLIKSRAGITNMLFDCLYEYLYTVFQSQFYHRDGSQKLDMA
jgi:hypothetical protein